jgi:hypothetical protein
MKTRVLALSVLFVAGNSVARYYEPDTDRFLQEDPNLSIQQYTYAQNNPINLTDPSGLAAIGMGGLGTLNGPGSPIGFFPVPGLLPGLPMPGGRSLPGIFTGPTLWLPPWAQSGGQACRNIPSPGDKGSGIDRLCSLTGVGESSDGIFIMCTYTCFDGFQFRIRAIDVGGTGFCPDAYPQPWFGGN